ncbi:MULTISPECIES: hypothetical protein [Anoxybacillus]|jgi:hypothetical protein|uniref:Uncharacterized protein n=1 Tax=Anoxybacillus pushchinoensis TaxID=150248 RepID=A0A1I0THB2_9BACL|nr:MULTISPECIES: hypothetical protein [Anoxybacillus]NNU97475.1 hypothetical protein [Anoxybacillus sp. EFIL]SFA51159.1 hypothetical protein SAMN05216169_102731 [Anoxybacillus pushchinoensis]
MSSWWSDIKSAAKQTVKDQIWPVTIGAAALGGARDGANAAIDTINNNKKMAHISKVTGVSLNKSVQSVGKAVVTAATKGTVVGAAIGVGVNFGFRLGQERGWW